MVSKIQLPTLAPKEESAITSSVVDVFYTPKKRPVSSTVGDIAKSLRGVVPQLEAYEDVKEEIEITEQEAKADLDFRNENEKDFSKLVKEGKIPLGANPYYIKQYVKNSLREKAHQFNRELFDQYAAQSLDTNTNLSAFPDFYKSFSKDFASKNNLSLYDAVSMSEGFIPYAEASRSNLHNQHIQTRIKTIEDNQIETLDQLVESELLTSIEISDEELDRALINFPGAKDLEYEQKQTLYLAQTFQAQIDNLVELGLDPKIANDTVVKKVIAIAKLQRDEDTLLILDNIITDKNSGARIAGSYRTEIADALIDIQELQDKKADSDYIKKSRAELQRQKDVLNYFAYNEVFMLDIEKGIDEYNLFLATEGKERLTAAEQDSLRSFSSSYINGLQKENIILDEEGKQWLKEFNFLLTTDPNNSQLLPMLEQGWGKYFTTSDGIAYLSKYRERTAADTGKYFSDIRYQDVFNEFESDMRVYIDVTTQAFPEDVLEYKNSAHQTLTDLAYGIIEDLSNPAYLEKHKLLTENEKKQHLIDLIRKEKDRTVRIIKDKLVPASALASEDVDPKIIDQIEKGINPYKNYNNPNELSKVGVTEGNPYLVVEPEVKNKINTTDSNVSNERMIPRVGKKIKITKEPNDWSLSGLIESITEANKTATEQRDNKNKVNPRLEEDINDRL